MALAFVPPPPPPPMLGPYTPPQLARACSEMDFETFANWIWSTKTAVYTNCVEINGYENELNAEVGYLKYPLTPIPEEFLGLSATPPFPDKITPHPPATRAYRVDGTAGREIWNRTRENGTYLEALKGKPAEPPRPPYFEGLRAWKGMEEILLDKMKTEAIARRSPALLAWWRARHAPV